MRTALRHANWGVIRRPLTYLLILLAAISCLYLASFFVAARGQWNCGINDIDLIVLGSICAVFVSASAAAWRQLQPTSLRGGLQFVLAPWLGLVSFIFFLTVLAPKCPFIAR